MSDEQELQFPEPNEIPLEPSGRIKSVQSPDLNAQFETTKESVEAEIAAITLDGLKRGLRFAPVNGGYGRRR